MRGKFPQLPGEPRTKLRRKEAKVADHVWEIEEILDLL